MNKQIAKFFAIRNRQMEKVTYEDVRLETDYSTILPADATLETHFSRNIKLGIPIVSAAMDAVTEDEMAVVMAKGGGIGIIHRGLSPTEQARQVNRVKLRVNGRIDKPICVRASDKIENVLNMQRAQEYTFHSFPVIDERGKLVGLLTRNDFDFVGDIGERVKAVMTPLRELITAPKGTSLTTAYEKMRKSKKNKLPLVDRQGHVAGLYIFPELKKFLSGKSSHNLDESGHFRVAAAVGTGSVAFERAELLAAKGCDVFVIDTAHGDSKNVHDTVIRLKRLFPEIDVVAGNVSRGEAVTRLIRIGADGILVGQGPGSICTTRIVAGIGKPQVSAVYECIRAAQRSKVPICADGGIRYSGDIAVALALGASSVIIGKLLAGSDESPGYRTLYQGRMVKAYRGMGSLGAMKASAASRERYGQLTITPDKLVPEGVEGVVPYTGPVQESLNQFTGGIQAGMAYIGAINLRQLAERAEIFKMTAAGQTESHPHDIAITAEAPNYRRG